METKELKANPLNEAIYGIADTGLKESIRKHGIKEPLVIKRDGTIISGHRRWQAARALEIKEVPCRIETFATLLDEQEAVIEYNRQREKTFSQKMAEAERLEEIERERARERQTGGQGGVLLKEIFPEAKGQVRDKVAAKIGIGSGRTYEKAAKVWQAAKEGNEEAKELIENIDKGQATIHSAYIEMQKKPHIAYNSGNNEWYTPKEYIDAARKALGEIELDPASSEMANQTVQAGRFFTAQDDGLKHKWVGKVWMNPPYASDLIGLFCSKLAQHYRDGDVTEAIVLVNNATETSWFNMLIEQASAVVFPRARIKFEMPDGKTGSPLQGQAIIYLGQNANTFIKYFKPFGWGACL